MNKTFSEQLIENGHHIDERMRSLVDVLYTLPSIVILTCCGGHDPHEEDDIPETDFYVQIEIEKRQQGWRDIERIIDAISAINYNDTVDFEPMIDEGLKWIIYGRENADPEMLAEAIREGMSIEDDDIDDDEVDLNISDTTKRVLSSKEEGDDQLLATLMKLMNSGKNDDERPADEPTS